MVKNSNFYLLLFISLFLLISCGSKETTEKDSEVSKYKKGYYSELHRPQFHFSPEANWMNDPNGMVYLDGEYHLFYQYYPDSNVWGPMHWAHAISKDMVSWEHLPIALYPDTLGYIFSGSAVIDKNNTAGFGNNAMVAIYTYHDMEAEQSGKSNTYQYQAIAYSTDKGRTFSKYKGNPVIPNPGIKDFRDPKVIWDEEHNQWLMVFAAFNHVKFYGSKNLKDWTHLSDWGQKYGEHGGVWECPDIFPLIVTDANESKWVLLQSLNPGGPNGGSATQYFIGDFDGKKFTLDPEFKSQVVDGKAIWLDYGKDNYAGVTWSDIPESDGRKLFLGWMSNWQYAQVVPTEKWRSAMTIAREISLHKEENEYRLRTLPVKEISKLNEERKELTFNNFKDGKVVFTGSKGLYKLEMTFKRPMSKSITLKISNEEGEFILVGYDGAGMSYFIDRIRSGQTDFKDEFAGISKAPVNYSLDKIKLLIYIDHASIELFADDGRTVMTEVFFPSSPYTNVELLADNNDVDLIDGSITTLNGIWDND